MATFTLSDSKGTGTDGASFSTTVTLPSGGAERTLMGACMTRNAGAGFSGATFDGVAADVLYESIAITDTGTNRLAVIQFEAIDLPDPTDVTGVPFVATWLASAARHWIIIGGTSDPIILAPFDSNHGERTPNGSTAAFQIDIPIDIPQDGFAIAFGVSAANGAPTGAIFTPANIGQTFNGGLSGEAISFFGGTSGDLDAESQRAISLTAQSAAGIFGVGVWAGSFEVQGVDGILQEADGTGSFSAVGSVLADGVFSASGTSTVTWREDASFLMGGVAATTFVGNVLVDAVVTMAGVGAAAFVPDALDATFSMSGAADAVFSSLIPVDGALSVAGDSDAAWVGEVMLRWSQEVGITNVWTSEDGVV